MKGISFRIVQTQEFQFCEGWSSSATFCVWTQFGSKPSCGKTLVHDSNFHLTVLVLM